jgi:hypothetical protein
MPKGGPIDVDLSSPAVYQLWDNVRYVMNMASTKMRPFLELFGVVEGNGLTPFAASIDTTEELLEMVKEYFKPPKRDLRGLNDTDGDNAAEDVEYMSEDDEINQCMNVDGDEMSPDVMDAFMTDIAEAEAMCQDSNSFVSIELVGAASCSDETILDSESSIVNAIEPFFNNVDPSGFFLEFKAMLQCEKIDNIGSHALKIMELLQLGKIEKGAMSMEGKYKSLNARWFGCKHSKKSTPGDGKEAAAGRCLISRDTLVKFRVKRGKKESVECFRVLGIFSKHYNKWFIHWDSDQVEYQPNSKKFKILARMVKLDGMNCYKEVDLVTGGQWDTKSVFTLRSMADIVGVDGVLDSSASLAW